MKVDCIFVEDDGPDGKRVGGECSVCGERFFNRMPEGGHPRALESGVSLFLEHAEKVHHSTGGVIGGKRMERRGICA